MVWVCGLLGVGCSTIDCECGTDKVLEIKSLEFRAAQIDSTPGYTAMEYGATSSRFFVSDTVALDQSDFSEAMARMEGQGAALFVRMTDDGRVKLRDLSRAQLHKPIAIIADNKILASPVVQEVVDQGESKITGRLTVDAACGIVCLINDSSEKNGR